MIIFKVEMYLTFYFLVSRYSKTTLAKLIVNSINCDHIIINGSDENNVDTVRNKVKGFKASTVGFKDMKVIILDEFDYMTPNSLSNP